MSFHAAAGGRTASARGDEAVRREARCVGTWEGPRASQGVKHSAQGRALCLCRNIIARGAVTRRSFLAKHSPGPALLRPGFLLRPNPVGPAAAAAMPYALAAPSTSEEVRAEAVPPVLRPASTSRLVKLQGGPKPKKPGR